MTTLADEERTIVFKGGLSLKQWVASGAFALGALDRGGQVAGYGSQGAAVFIVDGDYNTFELKNLDILDHLVKRSIASDPMPHGTSDAFGLEELL